MQNSLDFDKIANDRIKTLLSKAEKFRQYGQNYNRHIATSANNLIKCQEKGHTGSVLDCLADELEIRLDYWIPKMAEISPPTQ